MTAQPYVNLHAHTAYSVLDGHATVQQYVEHVARMGHTHAAVTDHGTMSGLPEFFAACRDRDLTPIAGLEAYVVPGSRHVKDKSQRSAHHLTLLALDETGYRNLSRISTTSWLEGFYYSARADHDTLAEYNEGVVCLSGCIASEISQSILRGDDRRTHDLLSFHHEVYGERFFLELQNHGRAVPDQILVNRGLVALARKHGIKVVATNDSHFCAMEDGAGQKLLARINHKDFGGGSPHTYVRDNADMLRAFGDNALLRNTREIAAMVSAYDLGTKTPKLPRSPLEREGETPAQTLRRMCLRGLMDRFDGDPLAIPDDYRRRLDYELSVIAEMSRQLDVPFERYMLVIADLARFARESGIWFGPRGSAAGAICCWTLGVSEVDPVAHGLYFERFLNPHRVELPDVDMDFADNRRGEILQYLVGTYGVDQVARIVTFNQIGAKQALRDSAKVLAPDLSREYLDVADELADLVPESQHEVRLSDLLADPASPLARRVQADPDAAKVAAAAAQIAGRFRGVSTHAAGIVVGDRPLGEVVPLMTVKDGGDAISHQTQYDNDWLPRLGLLKLDVLGLTELTKMQQAAELIERRHGIRLDMWRLPTDDAKAWDTLRAGRTSGLFQLGKPGMTRAIQEIAPGSIDELAMVVAAYRPGAIANIQRIADRKHGRESPDTLHPALEEVLRPTWGFPVFQEQVIEILVIIAGYSRGEADLVRKAIGKKIPELMAKHEASFLDGARAQGHAADASRIWAFIEPFAGYGFNRAHAYCYAYLAYQSAWLKANYPAEFYAACLDVESKRGSKKHENPRQRIGLLSSEARDAGVTVRPPDMTAPTVEFAPDGTSAIRYGLSAIKGVGLKAAQGIVRNAPYESLGDYFLRNPGVTRDVHVTLARIGALPWGTRAEQAWRLERMAEARTKHQNPAARKGESGEDARRRGRERVLSEIAAIEAEEWTGEEDSIQDLLGWEIDALGLPSSVFPKPKDVAVSGVVAELGERFRERVTIAGMILSLSPFVTRKGKAMANGTLIDDTGVVEFIVWPSAWEECEDWLKTGCFVCLMGNVEVKREGNHREIDEAMDTAEALPLSSLRLTVEHAFDFADAEMEQRPQPAPKPTAPPQRTAEAGREGDAATLELPSGWDYAQAKAALTDLYAIADRNPGQQEVTLAWAGIEDTLLVSPIGVIRLEEAMRTTARTTAA